MKQAKKVLLAIIVLAFALPLAALLVPLPDPLPKEADTALEFRLSMAGTVLFAWLHIGTAILFWIGLKNFKARMRRAYMSICFALAFMSLAMLEIPVFVALSLFDSAWVEAGLLPVPYAIAAFLLFMGVRSFATALSEKGPWVRLEIVLPIVLLLAATAFGIVEANQATGNAIEVGVGVWNVTFILISAVLVSRIKRIVGPAYTNALAWFQIALTGSAFAFALPPFLLALNVEQGGYLAIPIAIAGIAYIRAGYAFNKISEY